MSEIRADSPELITGAVILMELKNLKEEYRSIADLEAKIKEIGAPIIACVAELAAVNPDIGAGGFEIIHNNFAEPIENRQRLMLQLDVVKGRIQAVETALAKRLEQQLKHPDLPPAILTVTKQTEAGEVSSISDVLDSSRVHEPVTGYFAGLTSNGSFYLRDERNLYEVSPFLYGLDAPGVGIDIQFPEQ